MLHTKLDKILIQTLKKKNIFGLTARVDSGADGWLWTGAAGNMSSSDKYFIASTTKLYTSAIVFRLRTEGLLQLDDELGTFLPEDLLTGIHVFRGRDYSRRITVRQLLCQTSGIADYFQGKPQGKPRGESTRGISLEHRITAGQDQSWSFEDVITSVKHMPAAFEPGKSNKALYSDTNYQLLGRIIEISSGKDYQQALADFILSPLQLVDTYLYTDSNDQRPVALNYKTGPLHIPKAMASFGPDGGIVSTVNESMVFLKAFFNGGLFPREYVAEFNSWNRVFFPLEYGLGVMRFKLPRVFSGFKPFPEFIGHSGLSGAFAYYCPVKDLYFTGTVNQIDKPGTSFKMMLGLNSVIPIDK